MLFWQYMPSALLWPRSYKRAGTKLVKEKMWKTPTHTMGHWLGDVEADGLKLVQNKMIRKPYPIQKYLPCRTQKTPHTTFTKHFYWVYFFSRHKKLNILCYIFISDDVIADASFWACIHVCLVNKMSSTCLFQFSCQICILLLKLYINIAVFKKIDNAK